MPIRAHQILTSLAIALVLVACAVPAATAGRFGPGSPGRPSAARPVRIAPTTCHQYCDVVNPPAPKPPTVVLPPHVTVVSNAGFSWGDAAVGFGAACGLALLASGLVLLRRHGRVREAV